MFTKATLVAFAAASVAQAAAPQGFNYAAQGRGYSHFKQDFENAQKLSGAPGTFNAARLYSMVQDSGASEKHTYYIEALQAAVDTKTYLLLGMWASGGSWQNETTALKQAIESVPDVAPYILGLSVGSEDLYRDSPVGIKSSPEAGPGQQPDILANYIKDVKDSLKSTSWSGVKVGHVDTWTAWVNGSNNAVIDAADFLGVDAYPYYQNTEANGVSNGKSLFNEAMDKTKGVANGKEVWITETGWPVTGKQENQATANTDNAKTYWQQVGCPNFGNTPTFWYTLNDAVTPNADKPSFSITDSTYQPLFDLSCDNVAKSDNATSSSTSSSASSTGSSTSTAAKSTATGSTSSGSGSSNGTYTGSPSTPSGTSSSGHGSASGTGTVGGAAASSSGPATGSASTLSFSFVSMAALAAGVVALL